MLCAECPRLTGVEAVVTCRTAESSIRSSTGARTGHSAVHGRYVSLISWVTTWWLAEISSLVTWSWMRMLLSWVLQMMSHVSAPDVTSPHTDTRAARAVLLCVGHPVNTTLTINKSVKSSQDMQLETRIFNSSSLFSGSSDSRPVIQQDIRSADNCQQTWS